MKLLIVFAHIMIVGSLLSAGVDGMTGATAHVPAEPVEVSTDFDSQKLLSKQLEYLRNGSSKPVYLVRESSPKVAAKKLMSELSPKLTADTPVFIKPNIGGFAWFRKGEVGFYGRVTNIDFVEGIVEYLEEQGVKSISIGDGKMVNSLKAMQRVFRGTGYTALAKRHRSVRLVDLNCYGNKNKDDDSTPIAISLPNARYLKTGLVLPKVYVHHLLNGLVINVPKLKTHRFARLSAGMKNLMGVIGVATNGQNNPSHNRWRMHEELADFEDYKAVADKESQRKFIKRARAAFAERLCDAFLAAQPHITLVDGVEAWEGDGFDKGQIVRLNCAIGSYNTLYADRVAAKVASLWNEPPVYLERAFNRYYGGVKPDNHYVERGALSLLLGNVELSVIDIVED